MPEPARYSEKRLKDDFTAYLLFDEPLEFATREVLDAVAEDFPHMEGWRESPIDPFPVKNTAEPVIGMIDHPGADPTRRAGTRTMILTGMPGSIGVDLEHQLALAYGFPEAREAVARHRSYLSVSLAATGTDLAARFVAARDLTCLTAVFAALPICSAVYFPNGDVIARPDQWVKAAKMAALDEWPLEQWMAYGFAFRQAEDGRRLVSCASIGMAAFNGYEIGFAQAPIEPAEAYGWVQRAVWLQLAGGNVFHDGDTTGVEGDDLKVRIRHCAEGREIAPGERGQTDRWILIHPESPHDDRKIFGERPRQALPPGMTNEIKPQKGFLSRLLGRGHGGTHPN